MLRWKTCRFGSGVPAAAARWAMVLAMGGVCAGDCLAQEAADACADAPTVGTGTFQTPFGLANNEGFTAPCDPAGSDGSPDVWLDYVPAANGTAIFNTCGLTSADTSIAVLDGCPDAGGTVLACNDDFALFCSSVSLAVEAGHHYKVRIAKVAFGPPGLNPRMSIDFVPVCTPQAGAPANDCCAAATTISPSVVPVSTTGATRDFAGECGLGSPFPDVWYSFTPAASGNYRIKQDAGAEPLEFVILSGGCQNPTVVACHAGVLTNIEQVVFEATAGTTYLIRVNGENQPELASSFILEPVAPPTNDDCDTAQVINGFGTFSYDSTLANNTGPDDGNQCSAFGTGDIAHDVWFLWTGSVPAGEDVEISTCGGSPLDTRLSVYVGGCNGAQPMNPVVACNDDYCLGIHTLEGVAARLVFRPVTGVPYLIRVGSFPNPRFDVGGYPGTFTIDHIPECHVPMPTGATVEPEPCGQDTNGGCFASDLGFTDLPCGTTTIYGTALWGNDDWYQFSTPVNTNVTVAFQSEFAGEADLLESVCPPGPFAINLLRRNDGCAEFATPDFTQPINAGTYYLAIVNLDPFATCDYHSHYVLTVSVERCAPIGRCCGSAGCTVTTQADCAASGGAYAGDGTTCPSPEGHYDAAASAGAVEDISATGTPLTPCGDNCGQSDVPIGFTFNYFGFDHATIDISTNGFMTFDADFFLGSPFNTDVPGFLPHQLICPLWQDYDTDPVTGAGNVYYQTLGAAPARRFVVMWKGLATQDVAGTTSTFEAVFFEGSNTIQFRYGSIDLTNGPTAGICNPDGTIGTPIDTATLGTGVTLTRVVDPSPCGCPGDFNHSGAVSVQDIFDFLTAYFTGAPSADINHSGSVSVQDIFDFLTAYFTPCP